MIKADHVLLTFFFVVLIVLLLYIFLWEWNNPRKQEIARLVAMAAAEAAEAEKYLLAHPFVCVVCYSPTNSRCARCKSVRYCSAKCQVIDWKNRHRDECNPRRDTSQFSGLKNESDENALLLGDQGEISTNGYKSIETEVQTEEPESPMSNRPTCLNSIHAQMSQKLEINGSYNAKSELPSRTPTCQEELMFGEIASDGLDKETKVHWPDSISLQSTWSSESSIRDPDDYEDSNLPIPNSEVWKGAYAVLNDSAYSSIGRSGESNLADKRLSHFSFDLPRQDAHSLNPESTKPVNNIAADPGPIISSQNYSNGVPLSKKPTHEDNSKTNFMRLVDIYDKTSSSCIADDNTKDGDEEQPFPNDKSAMVDTPNTILSSLRSVGSKKSTSVVSQSSDSEQFSASYDQVSNDKFIFGMQDTLSLSSPTLGSEKSAFVDVDNHSSDSHVLQKKEASLLSSSASGYINSGGGGSTIDTYSATRMSVKTTVVKNSNCESKLLKQGLGISLSHGVAGGHSNPGSEGQHVSKGKSSMVDTRNTIATCSPNMTTENGTSDNNSKHGLPILEHERGRPSSSIASGDDGHSNPGSDAQRVSNVSSSMFESQSRTHTSLRTMRDEVQATVEIPPSNLQLLTPKGEMLLPSSPFGDNVHSGEWGQSDTEADTQHTIPAFLPNKGKSFLHGYTGFRKSARKRKFIPVHEAKVYKESKQ